VDKKEVVRQAVADGKGILRLAPNWVPRAFCIPGGRLKLHPNDLYALGKHRGGIDERWLASTTKADNGPGTPEDEGLSYIVASVNGREERVLLKEAIELMGDEIIGKPLMEEYGGWPMFSKFFDNHAPLPHHVHLDDEAAARVGALGKPEAYYFPPHLNFTKGLFPYTFFGLRPGTTKEEVIECLRRFDEGDNKILELSQAYKLEPGTGWYVPPGLLHAPGTLVTYEPQRASDVFSMFQSIVWDQPVSRDLLLKDIPQEYHDDLEYIVSILDWEENVDPYLAKKKFLRPVPVKDIEEMKSEGYIEKWIVYGSEYFSAKELTVLPGRTVTIKDDGAYGAIVLQGHGRMGPLAIEAPTLIRYGQMTQDEVFVTYDAAREGITIVNESETDELVMLKHFGPGISGVPNLPE